MGVTPHKGVDWDRQPPEESSSCFEKRDRKLGTLQIFQAASGRITDLT
jgi:hypothetical protein